MFLRNAEFIIGDSQAQKDEEESTSAHSSNDASISHNYAERNGGGVYAVQMDSDADGNNAADTTKTVMTISDGLLSYNTAGSHGGGLAMFQADADKDDLAATISGEIWISGNQAACGGAFYVGGGSLDVQGGVLTENKAVGTPAEDTDTYKQNTAYYAESGNNVGVGGGIYVYKTGKLTISAVESKMSTNANQQIVSVYGNVADFAADDVYCAPHSNNNLTASIKLPDVDTSMTVEDSKRNMVGTANGWFEDYPSGDTQYSKRTGSNASNQESTGRYKDAAEDAGVKYNGTIINTAAVSTGAQLLARNVVSMLSSGLDGMIELNGEGSSDDAIVSTKSTYDLEGYTCLTLGFKYTRVSLTVEQNVPDSSYTHMSTFNYVVTITGKQSDAETTAGYPSSTDVVFDYDTLLSDGVSYKITSTEGPDDDGNYTATVKFSLNSGQKAVLQGIPSDAKVSVVQTYSNSSMLDSVFYLKTELDKPSEFELTEENHTVSTNGKMNGKNETLSFTNNLSTSQFLDGNVGGSLGGGTEDPGDQTDTDDQTGNGTEEPGSQTDTDVTDEPSPTPTPEPEVGAGTEPEPDDAADNNAATPEDPVVVPPTEATPETDLTEGATEEVSEGTTTNQPAAPEQQQSGEGSSVVPTETVKTPAEADETQAEGNITPAEADSNSAANTDADATTPLAQTGDNALALALALLALSAILAALLTHPKRPRNHKVK